MTIKSVPFKIEGHICPEDYDRIDNMGFEVTQQHVDKAAALYVSIVEQNYIDDMFEALQIANQDIEDEDA